MNELRNKAISGAGWTFGSAVIVRMLQLLVTVVLARLLVPSDFGLFALAFMIINAINVFRDYGLAQSLIYERSNTKGSADATFWMSTAFGIGAWLVLWAFAPFFAGLFARPSLIDPLRVMGASVAISSAALVPSALLEKELLFRKRAVPEVANGTVYAISAIILAYMGYGVWSLVTAQILGTVASSVSTWIVAGWRPGLTFASTSARKSLSYGRHLMLGSIMVFAFFYIDHAAIGRFLGTTALGFYSLAFTICNLPATNITHVVNKVMFPTYTKLNNNRPSMAKAYLQTINSISALSFPLALAFCFFARDFVPVFFGQKWMPTVPLFWALAFYGLYRSIGATCGSIFMASGQPQWVLRMNSLQVLIVVIFLYPVVKQHGLQGIAVLFTLSYVVGTTLSIWKVKSILELSWSNYIYSLRGPFVASLTATLVGFVVAYPLTNIVHRIVLESVISVSLYVWMISFLDKATAEFARELFSMVTRKTVRVRV